MNSSKVIGFFIGFLIVCAIMFSYTLGVQHETNRVGYAMKSLSNRFTGFDDPQYINGVYYSTAFINGTAEGYLLVDDAFVAIAYKNKFIGKCRNLYLFGNIGKDI